MLRNTKTYLPRVIFLKTEQIAQKQPQDLFTYIINGLNLRSNILFIRFVNSINHKFFTTVSSGPDFSHHHFCRYLCRSLIILYAKLRKINKLNHHLLDLISPLKGMLLKDFAASSPLLSTIAFVNINNIASNSIWLSN